MVKRELIALLSLSSWCLVIVVLLFLVVPWGGLQFVIVLFHDHTNYLLLYKQLLELSKPFLYTLRFPDHYWGPTDVYA